MPSGCSNTKRADNNHPNLRLKLSIRGTVQGVGFRPFIYRLATGMGLNGWVNNSTQGVFVEVEGKRENLEVFLLRIEAEKPPRSSIHSLESLFLDTRDYEGFEIRQSDTGGDKTALVLPDIATCPDCLNDIFDPANRRYLYPFTNCTNCGPRYSIINTLPYDRPNTSMKQFHMCPQCQAEYENPLNRRFHAQPNACPECGPHLELWDVLGNCFASHHQALLQAADAIRQGSVVAVKGLGGFHLVVDARNQEAVAALRKRKRREEKPFALMYPTLEMAKHHCEVSPMAERLLQSPECPIILLHKRIVGDETIAPSVAPNNPYLGVMLPYTPLHHILMRELGFPIVATSGNLKEEPICTDEREALIRLGGIADIFLVHNRPIIRHVDDSIVRVVLNRELVLRRARGYAPLPMTTNRSSDGVLAVGGHLKNTIAVAVGKNVFVSQHIGDLETSQAVDAFHGTIENLSGLYEAKPSKIACDNHPDYISTKYAKKTKLPVVGVQHHYAHVLSCMAENQIEGSVLGVSWDGTGYGLDRTIWGGEFLKLTRTSFQRFAHFRTFHLPGGEMAVKEPRRSALGVLFEMYGGEIIEKHKLLPIQMFSEMELKNVIRMLQRNLNSPITSSAGRLFDAVASIVGIRHLNAYEGQAAMELEFASNGVEIDATYLYNMVEDGSSLVVDWEPMVHQIIDDLSTGKPTSHISAKFHNTLADVIVEVAKRSGEQQVALSGGCFQNKYLTEAAVYQLQHAGFRPYWHQRVPPNDGGIALGQVMAAALDTSEEQ
jgi:hydrogenase maturation protein HypF